MPKSSTSNHGHDDKFKRAREKVSDAKGNIFNGEHLDKINDLVKTALLNNSKFKIGHLIAGIAEHIIDSVLHNGNQQVGFSHSSEKISNADITIMTTNI